MNSFISEIEQGTTDFHNRFADNHKRTLFMGDIPDFALKARRDGVADSKRALWYLALESPFDQSVVDKWAALGIEVIRVSADDSRLLYQAGRERELRYFEDMVRRGLVSYVVPKTSTPNWEEMIFVEHIPDDMLDIRNLAVTNDERTLPWHLVVARYPGIQGYYELDGLGIYLVCYKDLAVARERLEKAAKEVGP